MNVQVKELFEAEAQLLAYPPALKTWLARGQSQLEVIVQHPARVRAAMDGYARPAATPRLIGDTAVLDLVGVLTPKANWLSCALGWTTIDVFMQQLAAALANPTVKAIVLHVDSPGGDVTMIPECADEIFAARRQKPIVAVADTMIASAAYWLASQATRIHASPSCALGSIGVYREHIDVSGQLEQQGVRVTLLSYGARKVDGNPYEPLPPDVRSRMQAQVDQMGLEFERTVGRGRGVTLATVQSKFGQGDVFRGREAVARRMADGDETYQSTVQRLVASQGSRVSARTLAGEIFGEADAVRAEHEVITAILSGD